MLNAGDVVNIFDKAYTIVKLLGHGKGGYSYLAIVDNKEFVLKQIHHEPCSYYQFDNKIEAELRDYERLLKTGIRIPKMIAFDKDKEIIIKEYIEGPVLSDLIESNKDITIYIKQMKDMLPNIYHAGLNIDYYPTNFIINKKDDLIYYIDYECNLYDSKWDFDNWGIKYWDGTERVC